VEKRPRDADDDFSADLAHAAKVQRTESDEDEQPGDKDGQDEQPSEGNAFRKRRYVTRFARSDYDILT
jgi:hypothetical protein